MLTNEQEQAIRRTEAAQRSGYTARKVRLLEMSASIEAAIADDYATLSVQIGPETASIAIDGRA